ncbi:MAG: class I SAM-dependent methyltransferase [Betaproteobacteria bacterium]
MKDVFDQTAAQFTKSIDDSIRGGYYVRGKLFVELVTGAVRADGYVLDYGCGPGRLALLLGRAGFRVLGVDTSPAMIAEALALERAGVAVEFETVEGSAAVLQPNAYDAVVCSSVIEYIEDPDELLSGFRRSLCESGALIISFANRSSVLRWAGDRMKPPNPMGPAQHHVWTAREFLELLERNGFAATGGPRFFEWSWHAPHWESLFDHVPFFGSIGVVTARPAKLSR